MDYQVGGADEEPVSNKLNRPADQASRMGMDFQMAGADTIEELGTSPMKPPFSNPPSGECQYAGADYVEEINDSARPTWPLEKDAGNLTKPL